MEFLLKAMLLAGVSSVLGLAIKKNSPEIAMLLVIAASCAVLAAAASVIGRLADFLRSLSDTAGVSAQSISIVLKTVGIGIAAKIASDVCRDAGHSAAAASVELLGSAASLYVALPLMQAVLKMIGSLI
ncbi:MAG: stage III sporulation protein AD [Oscillospiraceae bacterium]|nr:stage III sporulation protein AD [Oscillospiraceae bacterium]